MRQRVWMKGRQQLRVGRQSYGGQVYMVTTITQHRRTIFTNDSYARAAIRAFTLPALLKEHQLLCWVLMPDHVHWLIRLGPQGNLSNLVGSMKSAASRHVRQTGYNGTVWVKGFHDRLLQHERDIPLVTRYIRNNPVKAGLTTHPHHYPYLSPPP